jgi:Fe-S cluster assembly protein SufB
MKNQLHAACVELAALALRLNILQFKLVSWNKEGKGGVYNFVTKRGICEKDAKNLLDTSRNRKCHYMEVPSCILKGITVYEFTPSR